MTEPLKPPPTDTAWLEPMEWIGGAFGGRRRVPPIRPDWRYDMHPDDRAWLDTGEAPLRSFGWEPPKPTFMELYGDPRLTTRQWR